MQRELSYCFLNSEHSLVRLREELKITFPFYPDEAREVDRIITQLLKINDTLAEREKQDENHG